jgi:hypothetical protein
MSSIWPDSGAVVVELQGDADDVIAGMLEQPGDHRGVHASRHGHHDARRRRLARQVDRLVDLAHYIVVDHRHSISSEITSVRQQAFADHRASLIWVAPRRLATVVLIWRSRALAVFDFFATAYGFFKRPA